MNWHALSAIADIIGALGVIITLIYLAVQVRQNTHQLRDAAKDARLTSFDRTVESFARHREYLTRDGNADLYARGLESYVTLPDGEKIRFRAIIEEYFFSFHAMFGRVSEGTYDPSLWKSYVPAPASVLKTPGGQEWWAQRRMIFSPAFVSELETYAPREIPEK